MKFKHAPEIIVTTIFIVALVFVGFGITKFKPIDTAVEEVTQMTPFWYKTETPTPEPTPQPTQVNFEDWVNQWYRHCDFITDHDPDSGSYDYSISCYPEHIERRTCQTYFQMIEPQSFGGGEILILNIHRECGQ